MDAHTQKVKDAFLSILAAEQRITGAKGELEAITATHKQAIAQQETQIAKAWGEIEALMAESGEVEVKLPGTVTDYVIGWSKPRESIKADADATPDEFVKIERKPKLKEIGDHLKALRKAGKPFPNWASFEKGEKKLVWKALKK